jgi:hypothetical protein
LISDRDRAFFRIFGYLHIPGWFANDIGWITEEFSRAMAELPHDGSRRTIYPGWFIGATPRLATLLEHPRMTAVCEALLGPGYGLFGSDGNYYSGDTGWHSDAFAQWPDKSTARHLKVALYLDALTRDSGALRVIPGSHWEGDRFCDLLQRELPEWIPERALTMPGRDVPATAIESRPGDLVCFDHRIKHASFGGANSRRMFTLNWVEGDHTPAKREAILQVMRFGRSEGMDWSAITGAWFEDPPAARAPALRLLKELGQLVMRERRDGGGALSG